MVTDFSSDTTSRPTGTPAEERAATLRRQLERGGSVRLTAFGHVQRRLASGQVAGEYGPDVLALGLAEGWLAEARRRATPLGDVVEYALRVADAPSATKAAEAKPETVRRPRKPVRVKRAVRQRKPDPAPAPAAAPAPQPCPFDAEVIPAADAEARRQRADQRARKPQERKPRKSRAVATYPPAPVPLPDGTECVGLDDAMARWGCTRKAVAMAQNRGRIDVGGPYRRPGHVGRARRAIALTEKTLAYAQLAWVDRNAGRGGGSKPGPRLRPVGVVEFGRGEEVLTRELFARLGYAGNPRPSQVARFQAVPDRLVNPANHRCGRLYTAGPELVAVAAALGVTVRLVDPPASAEPPAQPAGAEPEAGPADWRDLPYVSSETPAL